MDTQILFTIFDAKEEVYSFVEAFNSNDPAYVLTQSDFDKMGHIINLSILKSESKVYKDFMKRMVESAGSLIGKDINDIKAFLDPKI